MSEQKRAVFVQEGGKAMTVILTLPFALLGYGALRVMAASVALGDFWTIGIAALAVLAFAVLVIVRLVYGAIGPFLIVTPQQLVRPRTFRTERYPVTPQRRIGRYQPKPRKPHLETGTEWKSMPITRFVTMNEAGKLVALGAAAPGSQKEAAFIRAFRDIAGIEVEPLTLRAVVGEIGPDVDHWRS